MKRRRLGLAPVIAALLRAVSRPWPWCPATNLFTGAPCGVCYWCVEKAIRELEALNHPFNAFVVVRKSRAIGFSSTPEEIAAHRAMQPARGAR